LIGENACRLGFLSEKRERERERRVKKKLTREGRRRKHERDDIF
jgi:hypothetical protein